MTTEMFQWTIVAGIIAVFWQLLRVTFELKDLNHKAEFWGKMLSGQIQDLIKETESISTESASIDRNLSDIAERSSERFPTVEEIERRRSNEP